MGGYNRIEQTVGSVLDRFPRTKKTVESVYQRANYHLRVDSSFAYDLHEDATLYSLSEWFDVGALTGAHFVGFYDLCPWNGQSRFLVHELPDSTNPTAEASVVVLEDGERHTVARTNAWNYQQGSRLQWYPPRKNTLVFNDIEGDDTVSRFVTTDDEPVRTVTHPVQAVNPVADEFLSIDYRRLSYNAPGYGYRPPAAVSDETLREPADGGLLRVESDGTTTVSVSLAELMAFTENSAHIDHHIHHVVYAPDGNRFVFLHRWDDGGTERTQLFVARHGEPPKLLIQHPALSHFSWLDNRRLFLWGGTDAGGTGYYTVDVETGKTDRVEPLAGYGDGHPSVGPDGEWIVMDTYPDRSRKRHLTLYHRPSERVVSLGQFLEPFGFDGKTRCDLHPRWNHDGTLISIDSACEGRRQSYIIDVGEIVA